VTSIVIKFGGVDRYFDYVGDLIIDTAPNTVVGLFEGKNKGKAILKVLVFDTLKYRKLILKIRKKTY